ncbi:flagellar biosynthesis/type III secretory pathway chaperone [Paenibacillus phyllosphaerae]|uniref:Flagellar biosynthesis/type III secretory pathway chaperone n=1 Tax=Paenibacillus phyllosphaerae TaxID=274593 RepID=A0A7W5AXG3_9BACL|nr:flagellar protein FlgN [Paenibacillus phyllosphaerae]MBB3110497.1 flagellar biosynthesis/type III secretory pathway chaperone [Paenibacillus phyllosphaerae]
MQEGVGQIVAVLQELIHVHQQLVELGKEKQAVIAARDTNGLSLVTSKEKKCLQTLVDLEQQRSNLVRDYFKQTGLVVVRKFKLEHLIQAVYSAEEKKMLIETSETLRRLVDKLKDINDFNQQLIRMQLNYVDHSLDLLVGPVEEEVTYHRALQANGHRRLNKYDTRG